MSYLLFIDVFHIDSQLLSRIDVTCNGDVSIPIKCSRYVSYEINPDSQNNHA